MVSYKGWTDKATNVQIKSSRKPGELFLETTLTDYKAGSLEAKCKEIKVSSRLLYSTVTNLLVIQSMLTCRSHIDLHLSAV